MVWSILFRQTMKNHLVALFAFGGLYYDQIVPYFWSFLYLIFLGHRWPPKPPPMFIFSHFQKAGQFYKKLSTLKAFSVSNIGIRTHNHLIMSLLLWRLGTPGLFYLKWDTNCTYIKLTLGTINWWTTNRTYIKMALMPIDWAEHVNLVQNPSAKFCNYFF